MSSFSCIRRMAGRVAITATSLLATGAVLHSADIFADSKDGTKSKVESVAPSTDFDANRVFTDAQGQAVTGRIQDVSSGGIVNIARDSGGMINAKMQALSLDDQKYVENWYTAKILSRGRHLSFKSKLEKGAAVNKSVVEVVKETEVPFHYNVTIKSTAVLPLSELIVRSRTYIKDDGEDAGSVTARPYEEAEEKIANLAPNQEIVVKSAPHKLKSSKLDGDFEYLAGNKKRKTEDRVGGVWLRVYKNDTLIGEYAEPKSLLELDSWEVKEKAK